jgi:U3 small nucleolar RNA-associated protein 11
MMSTRAKDGTKIGDRGNKALPISVVKLLKTQDVGYIRTMLQKTRKERERLEESIVLEKGGGVKALKGADVGGRKIVFVESEEALEAMRPEINEEGEDWESDDDEEDADKEGQKTLVPFTDAQKEERAIKKKRLKSQDARRNLLEAMKQRENDLVLAEQELELQRATMSNSIGGINKNGVKWKVRERKR